jgi:hypothetical protein
MMVDGGGPEENGGLNRRWRGWARMGKSAAAGRNLAEKCGGKRIGKRGAEDFAAKERTDRKGNRKSEMVMIRQQFSFCRVRRVWCPPFRVSGRPLYHGLWAPTPRAAKMRTADDSVFNLASKPENRRSVLLLLTAMARAFRCPMTTTSFLPRVMPV